MHSDHYAFDLIHLLTYFSLKHDVSFYFFIFMAGGEGHSAYGGRVITVKWGEHIRRIGIDGTADAIKEAIRNMPLGNYTLHLDEGISIKVCLYDDSDRMAVRTEDKTLYTEDEFRDFLSRNGFTGLREINSYRTFDNLDDLRPGGMYQGVSSG
ncbi:unnamed protein product [Camellia sinensis]